VPERSRIVIPENLRRPSGGWNGNTEETEATNAKAGETPRSWPARLASGGLVWIVDQLREDGQRVLVADDGSRFIDQNGLLVPKEG
jgi:hypothetical protein